MRTLIVAATEAEIAPSIPFLTRNKVDFLVTGVGMVATAFKMGHFLKDKSYDLLLNAGIAGTFDTQQPLGTVFRVTSDSIFQFGAEDDETFIPIEQLGFGNGTFYEQLPDIPLTHAIHDLDSIDAITVNTVHGRSASISTVLHAREAPLLESMEGAAFFYAAQALGMPRVQIRSVSNIVEKRNSANWDIKLAISQLNGWIQAYVKSIS